MASRFSRWSSDLWGLTASDSVHGYVNWGGPEGETDQLDGTVVPCAPGGSLPFAPRECLQDLHRMLQVGGARVWGRYGFADAFNPQTGWVSPDVIGIDLGITLAMAENLRSGFCWKYFMRSAEARRAFRLAGFERESRRHPFRSSILAEASRDMRRVPAAPLSREIALVNTPRDAQGGKMPATTGDGPFEGRDPALPMPAGLERQISLPVESRPRKGV